jgi:hypothetical protein
MDREFPDCPTRQAEQITRLINRAVQIEKSSIEEDRIDA